MVLSVSVGAHALHVMEAVCSIKDFLVTGRKSKTLVTRDGGN